MSALLSFSVAISSKTVFLPSAEVLVPCKKGFLRLKLKFYDSLGELLDEGLEVHWLVAVFLLEAFKAFVHNLIFLVNAQGLGCLQDFGQVDLVRSVVCQELEHIIEVANVLIGEDQVVFNIVLRENGLLFCERVGWG